MISRHQLLRHIEQRTISGRPLSWKSLLAMLLSAKFTGSITLNFSAGRLLTAELGRPLQVALTDALDSPPQIEQSSSTQIATSG